MTGAIERDGDVDWFAFAATAGGVYRFEATLGSLADSYLYLYDPDGMAIIADSDDILWPDNLGSRITWQAEASGTYYLAVEAESEGLRGEYSLQLVDMSGVVDDHGNDAESATRISVGDTADGSLELAWDDSIRMRPNSATLIGVGYLVDVDNMGRIDAYGGGGNDRAYLYDSALDDYLEVNGNAATLNYGASVVSVSDFAWVQANSSLGGDDEKCIELIDFALKLLGAWMDE